MQGNQSSRNGFNWLQFIIDTWAVSVEVFLRRRFGWKYIGAQGAAVLLLIPLFTALWSEHDPGPLMCFFGAYLVMWAVAGAQAWWRRSRGEAVFSYYSGCPWLMSVFPRASEVTVKQWLEPILVGVVGAAIGERNVPLAMYLFGAGACLFMSVLGKEQALRRRVVEMNDAVIEQQIVAERFRDLRGDHF